MVVSLSVASSTFEANKICPPDVVSVVSAVLMMWVFARIVMSALALVLSKVLPKLTCPASTVMGPLILIALPSVMFCVLLLLPKVKPVSVLANV